MRNMIRILILILCCTAARSQIPVYGSKNVQHPEYANALDGKYAVLAYVSEVGHTKYPCLVFRVDTLFPYDTCIFSIYGILPQGTGYEISAQTDTSSFFILYSHVPVFADNQQGLPPDTLVTIKLPKYKFTSYRFAILRHYTTTKRVSQEDILIDAVFQEFPKIVIDTVRDTVVLKVHQKKKRIRKIRQVEPYDIRGAHVDTLKAPWWIEHDTATGLKKIRMRK